MRAVLIEQFGEPSTVRTSEVPRPLPTDGEVVVEVAASAVNRSDVLNARGAFPSTRLPRVPGRDFAGTVLDGPPDAIGTEVWGTGGGDLGFTRDGAHARYVVVPRDGVVAKPRSLSMEQAGASGLAYVTAATALLELARLAPGETVLLTGAAGGVGSAAARIAHWKGARVVGAVRGGAGRAAKERLGLDAVVDTSRDDVERATAAATDGRGADVALDTVGGPLFEPALRSLGASGRMVVITTPPDARRVSLDLFEFFRLQRRVLGLNTSTLPVTATGAVLRDLAPGFETGALDAPPIAERYPLEKAAAAYSLVGSGRAAGRVVLLPG